MADTYSSVYFEFAASRWLLPATDRSGVMYIHFPAMGEYAWVERWTPNGLPTGCMTSAREAEEVHVLNPEKVVTASYDGWADEWAQWLILSDDE